MSAGTDLLTALGQAYRGDWGGFDGRQLRDQLDEVAGIIEAEMRDEGFIDERVEKARIGFGLCRTGGSHWSDNCGLHGCRKEAAT